MNNKAISSGTITIAAVSLSLLGALAAIAVDETTKDDLTLFNPVEEQSKGTTATNPSGETVVPVEGGIAIR